MAIGADPSLRMSSNSRLLAPGAGKPAQPQPQQPGASSQRRYDINDNAVSDVVNNQLAAGVGAGTAAIRSMDRAGISRGKGQQYLANFAEASGREAGLAAANATESAAARANLSANQLAENTRERERLANEGLLERLRSAQASERLAQLGNAQDMYQAYRRGQFGLDSQRLDYTPLLSRLFDDL